MDTLHERIGRVWSGHFAKKAVDERVTWQQSETVLSHIAERLSGVSCPTVTQGIVTLLRKVSPSLPYKRGISVGCGTGLKEMALIEAGIVDHFDLYDFSEYAVETGRREALAKGLDKAVTFHRADVFAATDPARQTYDFVHWHNGLHHMLDVDAALRWSKAILAPRASCFFMFEYVGPCRFQWTDEQVHLVKTILESLDDAYFLIPGTEYMWKKEPSQSTVEDMIADDPSEAADSEAILPGFARHFPDGTAIPLGGLVYVLALDGILVNIPENSLLLRRLLAMDDMLSRKGHNYYAAAYKITP